MRKIQPQNKTGAKARAYCAAHGCAGTVWYAFGLIFEKIGCGISNIYRYEGKPAQAVYADALSCEIVASVNQLSDADIAALLSYQGMDALHSFQGLLEKGYYCAAGRFQSSLGCVCWISRLTHAALKGGNNFLISQCFTLPPLRGKGLYPAVIVFAAEYIKKQYAKDALVIIGTSITNRSSINGIQKAGFKKAAVEIKLFGWLFYFRCK